MPNSMDSSPFPDVAALASDLDAMQVRVADIYDAAMRAADEGIFVCFCSRTDVMEAAALVAKRVRAGETLPLAGTVFTVKDNLDVEGLVTSSNCPGYGSVAQESAPAIMTAQQAGAILIGKTTMDQFATGLNGTRTPGTICVNTINSEYIPGGSSSGSGVAVARGLCDFSFGSDTGGSGRVPAAMNGIVGLKPTLGLTSSRGMVYCNRSFDCIPIFTKTNAQAFFVLEQIAGYDADDPYSRPDAADIPLTAAPSLTKELAVVAEENLKFFGDETARQAYDQNLERLLKLGYSLHSIDFNVFEEAGDMVFKDALVAERLVDYGQFIEENPEAVLEPVRKAILAGRSYSAQDLYTTLRRLKLLNRLARKELAPFDALVVPTVTRMFKISEMLANPMDNNNIMGTYTYFANPLNLCAVSVPGKTRGDGLPSALCFVAPDGQDGVIRRIGDDFEQQRD